ncbi:MAG: pyridoxamine 5'-phosphate oxidase family protein [Desulfamplus sp.]|nr:pyridoxamine 5'-phosphate oxidase family protein [Desulfamplus sp.]
MRRKEKEITQKSEIEAVIRKSNVCRLGLSDGEMPYIVPLCFGYKDEVIYLHSALEGKKIDILQKNQNVCFEFDVDVELKKSDKPCSWGMNFQSVIGFGKASFVEDFKDKQDALNIIMGQYSDGSFEFSQSAINAIAVIKIEIISMTGKRSGV